CPRHGVCAWVSGFSSCGTVTPDCALGFILSLPGAPGSIFTWVLGSSSLLLSSPRHSERSGPIFSSAPPYGASGREVRDGFASHAFCAINLSWVLLGSLASLFSATSVSLR